MFADIPHRSQAAFFLVPSFACPSRFDYSTIVMTAMNSKPDKKWLKRVLMMLAGFVGLVIFACAMVRAWVPEQQWLHDLPQATKVYTSYVPSTTKTIEGWADVPDIFGDFSMEIVFTLSDDELNKLLDKGFAWFPSNWRESPSNPNWQIGPVPQDLLQRFSQLENKPKDGTLYTYLQRSSKQISELVVIDREKRLIYYARASW